MPHVSPLVTVRWETMGFIRIWFHNFSLQGVEWRLNALFLTKCLCFTLFLNKYYLKCRISMLINKIHEK